MQYFDIQEYPRYNILSNKYQDIQNENIAQH